MDGYGFKLIASYKNGDVIEANGYMKFLKNYSSGHEALEEFLKSIK